MAEYELILDSEEWYSVRDEDGALIIHKPQGPHTIYPAHIYSIDTTEDPPKIILIFDWDNGPWEEYSLLGGWRYRIDDVGTLWVFDEESYVIDILGKHDYYIANNIIYSYEEPDGITYFGDDEETGAVDEFDLFGDLPYEESDGQDDWNC